MATYTWKAIGAGSWNVTGNWLHNGAVGVPTAAGSDLLFTGTATTTINYNVSTATAYNTLYLDDPNATLLPTLIANRTINVNFASHSLLTVNQGSLVFGTSTGTHTINASNVTISGGTVTEGARGNLSVAATGVLTLSGGSLNFSGGAILATNISVTAGMLTGYGTVGGSFAGTGGTVLASGGTLYLKNNIAASDGTAFQIAGTTNSVLKLDGNVGSGDIVKFNGATAGVLEFGTTAAAAGFGGTIAGFAANASATSVAGSNFINLQTTVDHAEAGSGTSNVFNGTATSFRLYADAADTTLLGTFNLASAPTAGTLINVGLDSVVGTGTLGGSDIFMVCYAAGTLILTEHGEVPVEALAAGDRVATLRDGRRELMAIKWMGQRSVNLAAHPYPHMAAPVRIRQNAFGDNLPRRDLLVSPAHAIFTDAQLVPANLLINHMTITQELHAPAVTYYHIELDRHAVIFAEGLTAESYLDTGNRAFFADAGMAMVLHPEFQVNAGLKCWQEDACAPLAIDAEKVAPIWRQLAERAEALGYVAPALTTTHDADIHLVANGRRLRPVAATNGRYTFMLPAGVSDLRLASRATAPADLNPLSGDWRPLGVAVRTMTLRIGGNHQVIPADYPGLTQGWHTAEKDDRDIWRWTTGEAVLPLDTAAGPAMLDIELGQVGSYILARSASEQRLAA